MRYYEQKEIIETREILTKTVCDLCGVEAFGHKWNSSLYDEKEALIEISIYYKDGYSCPDGGAGTEFSPDICPKCFKEKLMPWLKSQGCKQEPVEWGF
jgi:hypothetical protein